MRIDNAKIRMPGTKEEKVTTSVQRVSTYTEAFKGEYYNIDVTKLIPFKNQSRKHFDHKSLEELASTIKAHGIRQPLTILPSSIEEGKYEIISGERRWRAAKMLGMVKVPCIIIHDAEAAEEIALIENIQRKNLHPLELMQAFQSLLDRKICSSTQEIAIKLGITKSTVVETLGLNNLPTDTQETLLDEGIKVRKVLRELVKSPVEKHQKIIDDYKNSSASVKSENSKKQESSTITIHIKDGKILFQTKLSMLSDEEKRRVKKSLLEFLEEF